MSSKRIHDRLYGGLICRAWWAITATKHWGPAMALAHELTHAKTENCTNEPGLAQQDAMEITVVKINEC